MNKTEIMGEGMLCAGDAGEGGQGRGALGLEKKRRHCWRERTEHSGWGRAGERWLQENQAREGVAIPWGWGSSWL